MANPKCKCCGKEVSRKTAVKEEYIQTQNLKLANRYFCNQECYDKFHFEDTIKDNFYRITSEILNIEPLKNWYFKKRLSELKDKNKAFLILYKKKEEFLLEFESTIRKMRVEKSITKNYEIAVYINLLETYSKKYVDIDNQTETKIELIDYIDYENAMPKGKQAKPRKTIFDID